MILSATLSKPVSDVQTILGKPFEKIKIKAESSAGGKPYFVEEFTKTQVFHEHFTETELTAFLELHAGKTFKNCVQRTEDEEITILANKKGKITRLVKKLAANTNSGQSSGNLNNTGKTPKCSGITPSILPPPHKKNYLIQEGSPVQFLVLLGVMTDTGKIIASKYDKFRQINRFLEFIDDILPEVMSQITEENHPLRIADFGCGKSYLPFAVHYYLTQIKNIPCEITGLDLKEDVIKACTDLSQKLNCKGLEFKIGNIADYTSENSPDIVITLHACDTATDFALKYAVERQAKAILSVPCCQHQINTQIDGILKTDRQKLYDSELEPLLKWGIIKEKFSSLLTDAIRGEWLESQGYKVQMLEFIDMEHTPKNILIRAVRHKNAGTKQNQAYFPEIARTLGVRPEILQ